MLQIHPILILIQPFLPSNRQVLLFENRDYSPILGLSTQNVFTYQTIQQLQLQVAPPIAWELRSVFNILLLYSRLLPRTLRVCLLLPVILLLYFWIIARLVPFCGCTMFPYYQGTVNSLSEPLLLPLLSLKEECSDGSFLRKFKKVSRSVFQLILVLALPFIYLKDYLNWDSHPLQSPYWFGLLCAQPLLFYEAYCHFDLWCTQVLLEDFQHLVKVAQKRLSFASKYTSFQVSVLQNHD